MKAFFPKRTDGTLCPCPFIGFRANSPEEFKEIIKQFFNKETGYPGLYFDVKDKDLTLIFSGHQYEHPEGKPWCLFRRSTSKFERWFSLKDNNEWFDLLEDAEEIDKKIKMLEAIVKSGGLAIKVK